MFTFKHACTNKYPYRPPFKLLHRCQHRQTFCRELKFLRGCSIPGKRKVPATHHILICRLYHQRPSNLFGAARVCIATYIYWCKHQARETIQQSILGGKGMTVAYFEADMNSLGSLMCATWNCEEVVFASWPENVV